MESMEFVQTCKKLCRMLRIKITILNYRTFLDEA